MPTQIDKEIQQPKPPATNQIQQPQQTINQTKSTIQPNRSDLNILKQQGLKQKKPRTRRSFFTR